MSTLYPLRFVPILRRYLWGGRGLELLGKSLPPGDDYAESWEIVDHGADQSVVAYGPLVGTTLAQLVASHGKALFGRHAPQRQFPLLFKFLDAHDRLSIQVHPDDARAARLDPPDRGKTEAWVIVHAEPGAHLWAGLKRGFDRRALEREVTRGTCDLCIERSEPSVGDCFFLPAGVVHALGPGLLVAEIQQASDTTYRLHDWNRVGPDGRPRALHIDASLEAINYHYGPVAPQTAEPTATPGVERLVTCDKFILDRWQGTKGTVPILRSKMGLSPSGPPPDHSTTRQLTDGRFHILAVLTGTLQIAGDPANKPLARGDVALIPATCTPLELTKSDDAIVLDAYLP